MKSHRPQLFLNFPLPLTYVVLVKYQFGRLQWLWFQISGIQSTSTLSCTVIGTTLADSVSWGHSVRKLSRFVRQYPVNIVIQAASFLNAKL